MTRKKSNDDDDGLDRKIGTEKCRSGADVLYISVLMFLSCVPGVIREIREIREICGPFFWVPSLEASGAWQRIALQLGFGFVSLLRTVVHVAHTVYRCGKSLQARFDL